MGRVCGLWDILLKYRITHPLFWMGEANVLLDSQTAGESNGSWWEKEMPDLPELTLEKDIKNSGKWKCWSEYIMWGQKTYQKIILHRRTQRHKGIPIRITADLSIETLQARREWQNILKVMKEKTYNPYYCTQQGFHPNMKEKSKALQTSKSWENSAPPNQLSNKC